MKVNSVKTLTFESSISEIEKINPLFTRCKIKVAYVGLNRNNSFITEEAFEKAKNTIFNCPIVGEWNETVNDFRGHGGKIEVKDGDIKYIQTTQPYGVIDSNSELTWETMIDDGEEKKYLCATGFLWTGRYPELESIIKSSKSHSMEIEIVDGKFDTINNEKVFKINEFVFSGFCILGDDVEPCFEQSEITTFSLNKEKFKLEFKQMMTELKFSLSSLDTKEFKNKKEGGQEMTDDNKEVKTEEEQTAEESSLKNTEVSVDKKSCTADGSQEENAENDEQKQETEQPEAFESTEETSVSDDVKYVSADYALSIEQLKQEVSSLVEHETFEHPWGFDVPKYCYVDYRMDNNVVIVQCNKTWSFYGFPVQIQGDKVVVDMTVEQRYKIDWIPMELPAKDEIQEEVNEKIVSNDMMNYMKKNYESQINYLKSTLDKIKVNELKIEEDYTQQIEQLNNQIFELKCAEVNKEKEAIFNSFSLELTEEEIKSIKEKSVEMSVDEIETALFALVGKKKAQFNMSKQNNKIPFLIDEKPKSNKEYASLIEEYRSK